MRVADLTAGAVVHVVGERTADGVWVCGEERAEFSGPKIADLVPRVDALRDELRSAAALARGRVPRLRAFAETWGRELLPRAALAGDADVLVIVPHDLLHGLPLHLVAADDGAPLGTRCGITYASSLSQFARCAERNAARALDPAAWIFGDAPSGQYVPAEFRGGGTDVLGHDSEAFRQMARRVADAIGVQDATIDGEQFPYGRMSIKGPLWAGHGIDVLCVVAHGLLDVEDHRFSGLLLDREPGVGGRTLMIDDQPVQFADRALREQVAVGAQLRDGEIFTAAEMELETGAPMQQVALLGCSAGWSRMLEGDEPASIAETFLHLGVPSVAAPLWDAHQEATGDWAEAFFTAWVRGGMPRALAAREAQAALHAAGMGPERSGALALRGDWL